ncbi:helix-turn-helix domain-containing protein [Flavobacterium reichenbachii]|uniref:HTH araC/xylS-type domain-containing protein n=1 Tax=Flavobacterium reichenbachii TaxID=362418 RepID=A0A085ZG29_9FLAO|nr:AraC family transcriptional regulator [Flavobacterium reichenbachii]KFF03393.1 hypothetical protein IW19_21125 [Flavobacterium reichenbachii]OXB16756.1 hypothetical protein B0A68_06410 [Flavobacterium reichenbachii]
MKTITHLSTLFPSSLDKLAEGLETKVINNKLISVPKKFGDGCLFFTQITPNISALFIDVTFNTEIKFHRISGQDDLLIFHYDLSEHVNIIKINNMDYEIGAFDRLDLAIIDNNIDSIFKPAANERTVAIRLIINKNILTDFVKTYSEQIKEQKTTSQKVSFYHYGNIDSNSILLIQSVKHSSIKDLSFEPFLKGVSLKLLGNFFNKFYNPDSSSSKIREIENTSIEKTKEYLQNNVHGPFPSLTFLAAMAGMSESKYKDLFKKCYNTTPNIFFVNEKMKYGKKLLKSGNFRSLTEIIYELNYTKLSYFTSKYYEIFNRKPSEDFVKNRR